MKRTALLVLVTMAGCQTPHLDPNYAAQIRAYEERERAWAMVAMERARTEQMRVQAMQTIAETAGDPHSRQAAIMALAFIGGGGWGGNGVGSNTAQFAPLPMIPETQEDKALKWTQVLLGPTIGLVAGVYGYKMGVTQANAARDTTIAGYDTIRTLGATGYAALEGTARNGFMANASIANQGLVFGRDALAGISRPNVIVTNGVLGSGSYVGDNSGAFSGNTGRIGSPNCPNGAGAGGTSVIGPNGELLPGSAGGAASINCPGGRP